MQTIATSALVVLLLAGCAFAQGVPVIEVETQLVNMAVSVHDANGKVAPGLGKDDFTVVEDGVPQKIRFFAHDAQLPLSIGLIIDVSGSQEKFVKATRRPSRLFSNRCWLPATRPSRFALATICAW